MKTVHHFTMSTVAFLIGLGSMPALAQTAANDDTQPSPAVDQMVDRDIDQQDRIREGLKSGELTDDEVARLERGEAHIDNMESGALDNDQISVQEMTRIRQAQNVESGRINTLENNGMTNSSSSTINLTPDGQALDAARTQLDQAKQTEHQDFEQFRADEAANNATAVQQDRANLIAQQQTVATDRQTVDSDVAASRQALQPDVTAVQQDRTTLRTDIQQTRTDRQDGNTTALQQDMTTDQTARQNLQTADTTMQQDRVDDGLGGNSRNAGQNGGWGNNTSGQFASNQPMVNENASGQTSVNVNNMQSAGMTQNAAANVNSASTTEPSSATGSQTSVTAGNSTPVSSTTAAHVSVAPPPPAPAPHLVPHHH